MTGAANGGERSFVMRWRDTLRDSTLDPTAKLVGHTLGTYMNAAGEAFPSKNTLARGASLSTKFKGSRAVDGAVDRLEAAGLLAVTRRRGRRGFSYAALIPHDHAGLAEVIPLNPAERRGITSDESRTERPVNPARDDPEIPRHGAGEVVEVGRESGGFPPIDFDENGKPVPFSNELTVPVKCDEHGMYRATIGELKAHRGECPECGAQDASDAANARATV